MQLQDLLLNLILVCHFTLFFFSFFLIFFSPKRLLKQQIFVYSILMIKAYLINIRKCCIVYSTKSNSWTLGHDLIVAFEARNPVTAKGCQHHHTWLHW